MSKRRKMLLISSLIVLSSCMKGVPEAPEAMRLVPIWRETKSGKPEVNYFHGILVKAQTKFDWSNSEAYENGIVCTDLQSYNAEAAYMDEMKRLAKERCK